MLDNRTELIFHIKIKALQACKIPRHGLFLGRDNNICKKK